MNAPKLNQVVVCDGTAYGKLMAYGPSADKGFYFFDLKNCKQVHRYKVPIRGMCMENGDLSVTMLQHVRRVK